MYAALPPEVNTGRLIAGAMAEPYLQAEIGWQLLVAEFSAALGALNAQIAALSSVWEGMAAEQAQAAFAPYVGWLTAVIGLAEQRAAAAAAQAAGYTTAVAATPTLGEIAENHVTHAVLEATNFLGVNAVPLAVNEYLYFVELWNRASGSMYSYQAATGVNIAFPTFPPAPPIMAAPGAPQAGLAAILAQTAAGLPNSIARDALLASLDVQNAVGNVTDEVQLGGLAAGSAANNAQLQGRTAQEAAQSGVQASGQSAGDGSSQMVQQMMSQAPQMASQLPQQMSQTLGQGPQQLMQMASQPMQQITQLFQQGGLGPQNLAGQGISPEALAAQFGSVDQLGMYGTSPLGSAGGSFGGAGLLPSAGGGASIPLRSPAGWAVPLATPAAVTMQAAASTPALTATVAGGGASAVGSGAGMMGPMAAAGAARAAGTAVLAGAAPVAQEVEVAATLGFEVFDDEL